MRLDFARFIFVVGLLGGCRSADTQAASSTSASASAAPVSPPASIASPEPAKTNSGGRRPSNRPEPPALSSNVPLATSPAPMGDLPELHRRCDAFPKLDGSDAVSCPRDTRSKFCHQVVSKHTPEVAKAIIECIETAALPCSKCAQIRCAWTAIWEAPQRTFRECESLGSLPDPRRHGCDVYASSLSRKELERLPSCLTRSAKSPWDCYSDPATEPCWRGG